MPKRVAGAIVAAVFIVFSGVVEGVDATEKKLMRFTMEDQFSKRYTEKDLAGKLILMMASDKGGSGYSEEWALAIQDYVAKMKDTKPVNVVACLQLSDIPEFLQGGIKRLMPREKEKRVLMDWKDAFIKPYGLVKNKCNILVFNKTGDLIYQVAVTKYKSSKAQDIAKVIAKEQQKE